jgi:hypothetical protein
VTTKDLRTTLEMLGWRRNTYSRVLWRRPYQSSKNRASLRVGNGLLTLWVGNGPGVYHNYLETDVSSLAEFLKQ